jgi:hypothetical protein
MRKLFLVVLVIAVVTSFGVALADKPSDGNTKHPQNPPCDSDHGHPLANLLRMGKKCPPGNKPTNPPCDSDNHLISLPPGLVKKCPPPPTSPPPTSPPPSADPCTAAAGDPGLLTTDTLGQTLWDGGLSALSPLTEDPDRNGVISGPLSDALTGTPLEVVGDEVGCLLDLLLDENVSPIDL